jgi:hypothetical protein
VADRDTMLKSFNVTEAFAKRSVHGARTTLDSARLRAPTAASGPGVLRSPAAHSSLSAASSTIVPPAPSVSTVRPFSWWPDTARSKRQD